MTRLLLALTLACCACRKDAEAVPGSPVPAALTLEQFQRLRWLQGNWRGAESGGPPFFESYVFLDDSTIRSFTYTDSSFAAASDSGMIRLSGGVARAGGGPASWVVTRMDTTGIFFEPVHVAGNNFEWVSGDHDTWTATLTWPGSGDPPRARTYRMTRVGS
jgi:hypothetical protein